MSSALSNRNSQAKPEAVADELQNESEIWRQLIEKLRAREAALEEMEAKDPGFKLFAYGKLSMEFGGLNPLPDDVDLEALAMETGAQSIDDLLKELELESEVLGIEPTLILEATD